MSTSKASDALKSERNLGLTIAVLEPGSDYETLVLMLIDSARVSVSLLGQEFLGRWAAAHAVMALNESLTNPEIETARVDRDLIRAWCETQFLTIGFDPLTEEFL